MSQETARFGRILGDLGEVDEIVDQPPAERSSSVGWLLLGLQVLGAIGYVRGFRWMAVLVVALGVVAYVTRGWRRALRTGALVLGGVAFVPAVWWILVTFRLFSSSGTGVG